MDYTEFEFEQRGIDLQIQSIETSIADLQLQKERLNYEKVKLTNAYNAYLTINQSSPVYVDDNVVENVTTETGGEVIKVTPRRLKKND